MASINNSREELFSMENFTKNIRAPPPYLLRPISYG